MIGVIFFLVGLAVSAAAIWYVVRSTVGSVLVKLGHYPTVGDGDQ
jgi:hypothetical protein